MKRNELVELISSKHNPELAKCSGHVHQVWFDGEVTLQKSGELLNMRNLHTIEAGFTMSETTIYKYFNLRKDEMPNSDGSAYVTGDDAKIIRKAIGEYIVRLIMEAVS